MVSTVYYIACQIYILDNNTTITFTQFNRFSSDNHRVLEQQKRSASSVCPSNVFKFKHNKMAASHSTTLPLWFCLASWLYPYSLCIWKCCQFSQAANNVLLLDTRLPVMTSALSSLYHGISEPNDIYAITVKSITPRWWQWKSVSWSCWKGLSLQSYLNLLWW